MQNLNTHIATDLVPYAGVRPVATMRRLHPMFHQPSNLSGARLKIVAISVAAVAGASFAAAAAAQSDRTFLPTESDTGLYLAAALGRSSEQVDVGSAAHAAPFEVKGNALGLQMAAGYRPLPVWSAEAGYLRLGRASAGRSEASIDGLMLSVLGYLPTPLLTLYGRAGVLEARTYGLYGSPPALRAVTFHHRDGNLAFGIGLSTNFRSNLNFRLESQGFQITHASNTSLFSIAFVWSFL